MKVLIGMVGFTLLAVVEVKIGWKNVWSEIVALYNIVKVVYDPVFSPSSPSRNRQIVVPSRHPHQVDFYRMLLEHLDTHGQQRVKDFLSVSGAEALPFPELLQILEKLSDQGLIRYQSFRAEITDSGRKALNSSTPSPEKA